MKTIELSELISVTGGIKWEDFRQSSNVEDRRSTKGIARDNAWWAKSHATPLPPPRPTDIGNMTVPLPPRRPDGV